MQETEKTPQGEGQRLCRWISAYLMISTATVVVPCLTKPNFSAAASDTSMMRFREVGPWSLIVTSTLLSFFVLVIRSLVPQGKVLCAAVISDATYIPPQAVL
jgi:hypothetical protein